MHRLDSLVEGGWCPSRTLEEPILHRFERLAEVMRSIDGSEDRQVVVLFVPGRIELLGKHTDYAGGRSLVCATEQGICLLASPRTDDMVRMIDTKRGASTVFGMGAVGDQGDPHWSVYPKTVTRRLSKELDRSAIGVDIVFDSNLPSAAGLSSSSTLVIGTFMAIANCNDLESDSRWEEILSSRVNMASFLGAVESGRSFHRFDRQAGVGTRGGDQDHTAILCSSAGRISQFRFLPTVLERSVPLPEGFVLALGVSGVKARKTGASQADYNRISGLAAQLQALCGTARNESSVTLGSMLREGPGRLKDLMAILERTVEDAALARALIGRLEQFFQESEEVVPMAGDALENGDLDGLGACVERSMELANRHLDNQIEEIVWLVNLARELGAVASSGFGAGFGGAVWALVPEVQIEEYLVEWSASYKRKFPQHRSEARFTQTAAGHAAAEL